VGHRYWTDRFNIRASGSSCKNARGDRIVEQFITAPAASDAAAIAVAMRRVQEKGVQAARHLRDEIYEVRVAGDKKQFRILFATEGAYNQVLLALESFSKKTQKTPPDQDRTRRAASGRVA